MIGIEPISCGYALFRGPVEDGRKLGVVVTSHYAGLRRDTPSGSMGIQEPLPKELWMIHWTSTQMNATEASAALSAIQDLPALSDQHGK